VIYDKESDYYRIRVIDFKQEKYGATRALILDIDTHSIETEKTVESSYPEIYPAFKLFKQDLKEMLVIGGGAYTLPKLLKSYYPNSNVSVIEIDPEVKKTAELFFGLDSNKIHTLIGDARFLINKNEKKYDLIYGDVYNSFISVPGQLLTKEYNNQIKKSLTSDGIYALNFISSLVGKNSNLYKSILKTFIETFPNYYIFTFGNTYLQTQNITLIGINGTNHISENEIKKNLEQGKNSFLAEKIITNPALYFDDKALILNDDFHPTEKLISNSVKEYFPIFLDYIKKII